MSRLSHSAGRIVLCCCLALSGSPAPAEAAQAPEGAFETYHVENGRFRDSLRAWYLSSPSATTAASWASLGLPETPGSAWLTATTTGSGAVKARLWQCIPHALPGTTYTLSGSWYAPAGQPLDAGGGGISMRFLEFDDERCGFSTVEPAVDPDVAFGGPGNGGWQTFTRTYTTFTLSHSLGIELSHTRKAGQPAGTSGVYFDGLSVEGPFGFVKGDFDGGAETDLLLRNTVTNEHLAWLMNDDVMSYQTPITPTPAAPWEAVGIDDWNADGRNDLLMWQPSNGWLDFWLMNGTSRVGTAMPISTDPGPAWKPSATADFDHNGMPDIVLRNPGTQAMKVWMMNGAQVVGTAVPTPDHAVDANWEIVGAGDLNGDRRVDLLWYNWSSGRIVYWLLNDSLVRTTGAFTNPMAAGDANWKVLAMGDYGIGPTPPTGAALPGTLDLVWRNATSGRLVLWYMDRAGNRTSGLFVDPASPPPPATNWTVAGPR